MCEIHWYEWFSEVVIRWILVLQCCLWIALELSIWYPEERCCKVCEVWKVESQSSRSCLNSVVRLPATTGRTMSVSSVILFTEKGGEQGDPLMSTLFVVGQSVLAAVRARQSNEHLRTFHDGLYVCRTQRVKDVFSMLRTDLWPHCKIQLHPGKTQVWNRGLVTSENIDIWQHAARMMDLDAVIWRDDEDILTEVQGVVILGIPLGHAHFVRRHLQRSWIPTALCWSEFPLSLICNPLGWFCFSVRPHERTSCLGLCRLPPLESSSSSMTHRNAGVCQRC